MFLKWILTTMYSRDSEQVSHAGAFLSSDYVGTSRGTLGGKIRVAELWRNIGTSAE